jgi:hypothetical protein
MWKELFILGYRVLIKVYDEGSKYGIEGLERVSKLSIWKDGKEVLNYDRGWDFNELSGPVYWLIKKIIKYSI